MTEVPQFVAMLGWNQGQQPWLVMVVENVWLITVVDIDGCNEQEYRPTVYHYFILITYGFSAKR